MMRRKLKLGMLMVSSLSIVIVACGKKDGANYQRKRNDTGKVELDLKTAGDLLAKQIPDFFLCRRYLLTEKKQERHENQSA